MVKLREEEKMQAASEQHAKEAGADKAKKIQAKGKEEAKVAGAKKEAAKPIKVNLTLEDTGIIFYPLVTEKAVNMIESENKITFVVADTATKAKVKKVIQNAYGIKVDKINIIRDMKGRKKAIVRITKDYKAQDLATKLGVL